MAPIRVVTSYDGPAITVDALIKNPLVIPQRIISIAEQGFIADQLLRNAGGAQGGVVQYFENSLPYPENDFEIVNELAEIPIALTQVGDLVTARTRKRGLSLVISEEMRTRNNVDLVNKQITQVRNALVRGVDGAFMAALNASAVNTRAATAAWATGSAKIRADIAGAKQQIKDLQQGFEPDTLVINPTSETAVTLSDDFQKPYIGNVADQNPILKGAIPGKILGLDPFVSYQVPAGVAWVLQRKVVGGYADERPLQSTEVYLWKPEAETYRNDTIRTTVAFIDEPKAATKITGV